MTVLSYNQRKAQVHNNKTGFVRRQLLHHKACGFITGKLQLYRFKFNSYFGELFHCTVVICCPVIAL